MAGRRTSDADGTVRGLGNNQEAALGRQHGQIPVYVDEPELVELNWTHDYASLVPLDETRTIALRADGRVVHWGDGRCYGARHGLGSVRSAVRHAWRCLVWRAEHTLVLKTDGTLWCFGESPFGECGVVEDLVTTPV